MRFCGYNEQETCPAASLLNDHFRGESAGSKAMGQTEYLIPKSTLQPPMCPAQNRRAGQKCGAEAQQCSFWPQLSVGSYKPVTV